MAHRLPYSPAERQFFLDEVIDYVASGKSITGYCKLDGKPSFASLYEWMKADKRQGEENSAVRFARARELGAALQVEDALDLADAAPERLSDGRIDPGDVALRKLRIESKFKLAACYCPRVFGEKALRVAVGGDAEGVPIQLDATSRSARIQALVTAAAARRLQVEVGKPRQLPDDAAGDDEQAE